MRTILGLSAGRFCALVTTDSRNSSPTATVGLLSTREGFTRHLPKSLIMDQNPPEKKLTAKSMLRANERSQYRRSIITSTERSSSGHLHSYALASNGVILEL